MDTNIVYWGGVYRGNGKENGNYVWNFGLFQAHAWRCFHSCLPWMLKVLPTGLELAGFRSTRPK